jgi:hypothetical protein
LREAATPNERKNMVSGANELVIKLNEQCSIPKTGGIQRVPTDQEINCIKSVFQEERRRLLDRATGIVREEAATTRCSAGQSSSARRCRCSAPAWCRLIAS